MEKEDISINKAIIHILDSSVVIPVLSDIELDLDNEVRDFLSSHIFKIISSDDFKSCYFKSDETFVYNEIKNYNSNDFISFSKKISNNLFEIMKQNVEIPSADFVVCEYNLFNETYIAFLKMNYKESYIHFVETKNSDTINYIIRQKAALPNQTQKLEEAVVIKLSDYSIKLLEKKYEINGQKENYLSVCFLECSSNLSSKTKLNVISKTVDDINKKFYNDDIERKIEVKKAILDEYSNTGSIVVDTIADKIFEDNAEIKQEFKEKIDKYGFSSEPVSFQSKNATKKIEKQTIKTSSGIEINIPVEQYGNKDAVEFITNPNGTISVVIKNIYDLDI